MKANFKRILILGISILFFICSPSLLKAQDSDHLPCAGPDPVTGECPIDSGLLILIAIGAGYGIKKIIGSKKAGVLE